MKNVLLIIFKDQKRGITSIYSDNVKDSEKTIQCMDSTRINKKDIAFYSIIRSVPELTYKKASNILSDLNNNGYTLNNKELITYSHADDYFLIDNEEILSKGEFEEILYSELKIPLIEVAI